jgi:hypothetical protein
MDMGKHRGKPTAGGLLTWILRLRAGQRWIVRCRDEDGRRVRLQVSATGSDVLLCAPGWDAVVLSGLAVGHLRGALRAAAASAGLASVEQPTQRFDPPPASAGSRRWVALHTPPGSLGVPA